MPKLLSLFVNVKYEYDFMKRIWIQAGEVTQRNIYTGTVKSKWSHKADEACLNLSRLKG